MALFRNNWVPCSLVCAYLLLACDSNAIGASEADQPDPAGRSPDRIPPGTVLEALPESMHLVLLAKSRVASGDVEQTPELVRNYASMFHLVILAEVGAEDDGGAAQYRLDRVKLGLCATINGRHVVISSDTHKQLGANLDFVARVVLGKSEKPLNDVVQVARNKTMSIFDAPAIVLRNGQYHDMIVRHLIWVNANTGKLGTLIWLLEENENLQYRMVDNVMQALPRNFVEDRVIHVDANEFRFGVPSERAFAIVSIPKGRPIPVTPPLASLAARKEFMTSAIRALVGEVNKALARARGARSANARR